jgi:hypothetical protein
MIDPESEELVEGGKYLNAFDNTFNPENTKQRNQYDFSLIEKSLVTFNKENYLENLINIIIFDALIGNSDRHQENWAIINIHSPISSRLKIIEDSIESDKFEKLPILKRFIKSMYSTKGMIRPEIKKARLMLPSRTRFAPIYDSGCSFGRELSDERINELLAGDEEASKYINKGQSEIHWEQKKISHFELIQKLLNTDYKTVVMKALQNVTEKYDEGAMQNIVANIDNSLLNKAERYLLPENRKKVIVKLLTLRFEKLKEIYLNN